MLILAHRGAHDQARENTLEAFRAAGPAGADGVELDVRQAADGVLVVHHDPDVDGIPIAATPSTALPAWVPTLAEALGACGGLAVVDLEIKAADPAAVVADTGGAANITVSSFHLPTLDAVSAASPGLPTAWLTLPGYDQHAALAAAAAAGHRCLAPPDPAVTAELVDAAHAAGVAVWVWTVNDPKRADQLARWGVDAVITDRPGHLRR